MRGRQGSAWSLQLISNGAGIYWRLNSFNAMSDKFRDTYRIPSARLQEWDYGWNATYFITICTKDRLSFFGEVVEGEMMLSEIGQLAHQFLEQIPAHFQFVELDGFVVMPNHVHGIFILDKGEDTQPPVETRHRLVSTISGPSLQEQRTLGQSRFHHPPKQTLSTIIGSYKSVVTKHARRISEDFGWQAGFHDHIIRNQDSHRKIEDYILNNPFTWEKDKFYR
jgi:putative transposase